MYLSKVITAIALCVSALSAQAYPTKDANYDVVFQVDYKILQKESPQNFKTLKQQSTAAIDGTPTLIQHRPGNGVSTTVVAGKKTTTQNQIVYSGFRLVLTPEKLAPGQFEKTRNVLTQIHLDYFAEGQDGLAKDQDVVKHVAMAVGEQTNLDWSSNGEQYQLTLRLISARALKK
jgi:hypothetical protein